MTINYLNLVIIYKKGPMVSGTETLCVERKKSTTAHFNDFIYCQVHKDLMVSCLQVYCICRTSPKQGMAFSISAFRFAYSLGGRI